MPGFHPRTQVARDFPKNDSRDYQFQTQDLLLCHPEYTQRAQSYKITIGWVLSANSPASSPRKPNSTPPYVRMVSTGGKVQRQAAVRRQRAYLSLTNPPETGGSFHSFEHLRLCPSLSSPRTYGSSLVTPFWTTRFLHLNPTIRTTKLLVHGISPDCLPRHRYLHVAEARWQ